MLDLGTTHPSYLPSSILSKKIKKFHDSAKTLLPFLKSSTNFHEIDSEQTFNNAFTQLYKTIEPTVVHVRSGANSQELKKEIVDKLVE